MKKLIYITTLLLTLLTNVRADLYEDQYRTLQGQYDKAIKEYNRKYAAALMPILEKAKKEGNINLFNQIRQTLTDIGHPIDQDWFVGTWVIEDNDNGAVTRTYEIYANNTVKYVGRTENIVGLIPPGTMGSFDILSNGTIKATFGNMLIVTLERKGTQYSSARWKPQDYPQEAKGIKATTVKKQ